MYQHLLVQREGQLQKHPLLPLPYLQLLFVMMINQVEDNSYRPTKKDIYTFRSEYKTIAIVHPGHFNIFWR